MTSLLFLACYLEDVHEFTRDKALKKQSKKFCNPHGQDADTCERHEDESGVFRAGMPISQNDVLECSRSKLVGSPTCL